MLLIGFQFMSPSWCDAFALIIMFSRRRHRRFLLLLLLLFIFKFSFFLLFFLAVICFPLFFDEHWPPVANLANHTSTRALQIISIKCAHE